VGVGRSHHAGEVIQLHGAVGVADEREVVGSDGGPRGDLVIAGVLLMLYAARRR